MLSYNDDPYQSPHRSYWDPNNRPSKPSLGENLTFCQSAFRSFKVPARKLIKEISKVVPAFQGVSPIVQTRPY